MKHWPGVDFKDVYKGAQTRNGNLRTRVMLPRDYGIEVTAHVGGKGRQTFFTSPLRSAKGLLMVQSADDIKARLDAYASIQGIDPAELRGEFFEAMISRQSDSADKRTDKRAADSGERLPWAVITSGQDAVRRARRYTNGWSSDVARGTKASWSRADVWTGESEGQRFVLPIYSGSEDEYYNGINRVRSVDTRISALEWALFLDQESDSPARANNTGLTPSQRPDRFSTLFHLYGNGVDEHMDLQTTDLLVKHFVEGQRFYDVNRDALQDPGILTDAARELFPPSLIYRPLRQREQRRSPSTLSQEEKDALQHNRGLYDRMRFAFEHAERLPHGVSGTYRPAGLTIEFAGTPWEGLARRYVLDSRGRGPEISFSLLVGEDYTPVIVRRELQRAARNWHSAEDPFPSVHPHDRRSPIIPTDERGMYQDVDPYSRHVSKTKVIVPGLDPTRVPLANGLVGRVQEDLQRRHAEQQELYLR